MRFRPPVPDDAPAVLAVLAARNLADLGAVDFTPEGLRGEWRALDVDLDRDVRVVEADSGRIVAYAVVRSFGSMVAVVPEHEGQGIGSRLLDEFLAVDYRVRAGVHRQWVAANNVGARALLTDAGYRVVRSNWRMGRTLVNLDPAPSVPAGYQLRAVDPVRDAIAMHGLGADAFAGAEDYIPESVAEFTQEHLEAHDFEPAFSRVATRQDRLVGLLLARRWREEAVGFVDVLAVHPHHQGHGLGAALLQSAFAAFAADGLREAQLGVSSGNTRGLRLYERTGMTVRHRADIYERPVSS